MQLIPSRLILKGQAVRALSDPYPFKTKASNDIKLLCNSLAYQLRDFQHLGQLEQVSEVNRHHLVSLRWPLLEFQLESPTRSRDALS